MDDIIEEQGWSPETVLELMRRFIGENGLTDKLTMFLEEIAAEESVEEE